MSEEKLTVEEKNSRIAALAEAVQYLAKLKLSALHALELRKVAKVLEEQRADVNEVQKALTERHTKKDDSGKPVTGDEPGSVKLTDPKAFFEELGELYDATFSVPVVKLSWFAKDSAALEKLESDGLAEAFIKLGDVLLIDVS